MSDKRFDDFFKQSLGDYSPDVPGHIWENIAAQQKKKRPAGFWLNERKAFLVVAALLLLGAGAYLLFTPKNDTQNISLENNGSRQETGNTVPAAVLQNKEDTNATTPVESNDDKLTTENKTTSGVVKIQNEATASNDKKLVQNEGLKTNENAGKAPRHKKAFVGANDDVAVTGNISSKKDRSKLRGGKKYQQQVSSPAANDMADVNNDDNNGATSISSSGDLNIPYVPGSRDLILLANENLLDKQTIQLIPLKPREDCPGVTGNNYYIEAYISPDYVIKKYSDTANSSLVAKRKESLNIQSSYSAGIRYTRVFANGMSVRAGLNFSQVNEKFAYAQGNVVQIVYVINTQGDTTDSYYVRGTRYKNSYNRYRTIDVPLVVGYEMGNGNFHANINAGVVVNLYSWQKGETIDNNGAPVSITTGKEDNPYQYKTNIGVGFTSAISLYYKLNDRFHVLAEPYLRYNFSPMNKEVLSIQERFTTIGLRLGIRMDIK
ncbi:MAG: hypothetical protein V4685_12015 [Bacteroidota bacterium]